jgi:hypothetical protein
VKVKYPFCNQLFPKFPRHYQLVVLSELLISSFFSKMEDGRSDGRVRQRKPKTNRGGSVASGGNGVTVLERPAASSQNGRVTVLESTEQPEEDVDVDVGSGRGIGCGRVHGRTDASGPIRERQIQRRQYEQIVKQNPNVSVVSKRKSAIGHFTNYFFAQYGVELQWANASRDDIKEDDMESFATYMSVHIVGHETATGYLSSMRKAFSDKEIEFSDKKWNAIRMALKRKFDAKELDPAQFVDGEFAPTSSVSKKPNKYSLKLLTRMQSELFAVGCTFVCL